MRTVCLAAAVGLGCQDDGRSVRSVIDDLAEALCARIYDCCEPEQISCTAGRTVDQAECPDLVELYLRPFSYAADEAIDGGRRRVDDGAVSACVEQIGLLGCAFSFLPPPCTQMFPGKQDTGDVCFDPSECGQGLACSSDPGIRGVCWPLQGEDDPCADHDQCSPELYCSASGNVCRPRVELGAGCEPESGGVSGASLCERDLACDPDTGRCVGPGAAGDPCPLGWCEPGLACVVENGGPVCRPPRADGQACMSGSECVSAYCNANMTCAPSPVQECEAGWGHIGTVGCM